jgi:hypothetical protein
MGRIQEFFRHVSFPLLRKINRIIGSDKAQSVVEDNVVQMSTILSPVTCKFIYYKAKATCCTHLKPTEGEIVI